MESSNGHRPGLEPAPSPGPEAPTGAPGSGLAAHPPRFAESSIGHAAHGAVLVFVGVLAFFSFVIGSGILGTLGQVVISLLFFGTGLSWVWWGKMEQAQREHVVREVREYVRPKHRHA